MIALPIRLKLGRCFSFPELLAPVSDALLGVRDSCLVGAVKSPEERLFFDLKGDFFRIFVFFDVTGLFSPSLVPSPTPLSAITCLLDWFGSEVFWCAAPLTQILFLGAESALTGVPRGLA